VCSCGCVVCGLFLFLFSFSFSCFFVHYFFLFVSLFFLVVVFVNKFLCALFLSHKPFMHRCLPYSMCVEWSGVVWCGVVLEWCGVWSVRSGECGGVWSDA
jgi:hypothetical protein